MRGVGIFRRRPPVPAQPLEFRFMAADEWAGFNRAVLAAARQLGLVVERLDPGLVVLRGTGERGLLNLAQLCHAVPTIEWPGLIAHHLRIVTDPQAFAGFHPDLLRVRLMPDSTAAPEVTSPVIRPYAESVVAMLTVDLPATVRLVEAGELAGAGLGVDEAWARAWAQTRATERPELHETLPGMEADVHTFNGQSFFVSSLIEFLPDLVPDIGLDGALVAIPRRHTVLAHAIADLSVVEAVQALLPLTRRLHADGPGSVSAHLYWWRPGADDRLADPARRPGPGPGHLVWLPSYLDGDAALEFHPPPAFVEMLNTLVPRSER